MTALQWQQPADMPLGVARLSKLAFDGGDLGPLRSQLLDKYVFEPDNTAALMDLAVIEQLLGNLEDGLARQQEALSLRRIYRSPCAAAKPGLRLLAFAAPGDIGNNTPLEFLLEESDVALTTLYIVPGEPMPEPIPEHDVAIVTACESDQNRPALQEIRRLIANWEKPVLNHPDQIELLARERLHTLLKPVASIEMPVTVRIDRASLAEIAAGKAKLRAHLADGAFPVIARPIGSHAGFGLKKLADPAAVEAYLAERPERGFCLSRYVDYRSPDGLFRKYRVVFINGRPYACHMAIADQWMIYYLNAGMGESAAKQAEEERFMTAFSAEFGRRHKAALAALADRIGLDYFGIDCAQTGEGKLLLFEADIAMIVHLMDSPTTFPYKVPQMRSVFAAFCAMLKERAAARPARPRRKADPAA
jgi:glutathione synthase/RimK-type ligase-like ATP-grasp enzyme